MAIKKAKVITITSTKGGVGKTTTVLNLAGMYATMKKKVLIIDMDLSSSAIALSLNLEVSKDLFYLSEDIENGRFKEISDYLLHYQEHIDILAAPRDPRLESKISSDYLPLILGKVISMYDVILMDTIHHMSLHTLNAMDHSDWIVYLLSNDPMDLKNMKSMVAILKDMNRTNFKIVLNESIDHRTHYFSKYDIKNIIKDNIDYTIPSSFYIKNIHRYLLDGKIPTLDSKFRLGNKKGMDHFKKLALSLLKDDEKEQNSKQVRE
ncbi:MAG TPA: ParA family protein [Candidatus Pelethosoma merdigallinarum]|nr:ParA family protein [Candidatus Pelethosoma merdigallinarum]